MPRRPRIFIPDTPQHVTQRGVNRLPVFFCDDDYQFYLSLWREYAVKHGIRVHSYCLMTNHIHFLITAPSAKALSTLMQDIGRRYVQYINRKYARCGGLWQGRYKSVFVQTERYFMTCMRYIELNPVRAGMVRSPEDYLWSSYRSNALGLSDRLIDPHDEYLRLSFDAAERYARYRSLFRDQLDDSDLNLIRSSTDKETLLGDHRFVAGKERLAE